MASLIVGCFDPDSGAMPSSDTDDTDGTESLTGATTPTSSMSTTEPTTSQPTTAPTMPTSMTETTDDPTVGDDPPTVSLLVNGESAPPTADTSQLVRLEAEASDDGTVARVEIYDGDELIATLDAEPYRTSVLVTSLDNATHAFQARAYDDADQEGLSEVVDLVVDIEGGGTVASDTNVFQTGGLIFNPGGGAVVDDEDNIVVAATVTTTGFEVAGIGVVSYTSDLGDVNWQLTDPASLVDGQPQYLPLGQPYINGAGDVLLIGGNSMGTDGVLDNNASLFRFDLAGSGPLTSLQVSSDPDVLHVPMAGITVDVDGNVFLHGPDEDITKYSSDAGGLVWQSPTGLPWTLADLGMYRMRADAEGDLVTDRGTCDSMGTCTLTTTKINGFDGVEQWAEDIAITDDGTWYMSFGASTPTEDGGVVTLHGPTTADGGGVHFTLRDDNGVIQAESDALGPELYSIMDAAIDAQGQVTVVATRTMGDTREAWAGRFSPSGELLWERAFGFGAIDDHVLSLAHTRDGRLIVVGFANMELTFVAFTGRLWVALLDL